MSSDGGAPAAWAGLLAEPRRPLQENLGVQAVLVGDAVGAGLRPADLAERLVGIDSVSAEALVLLGPAESADLFDVVAAGVGQAGPLLRRAPDDEIDAYGGLALASCWNALLIGGRASGLPDEPTTTWLDALAGTVMADDPEIERRSAFVVAAVGSPRLVAALADEPGRSLTPSTDLARRVARAVVDDEPFDAVAPTWNAWLTDAPGWLRSFQLGWADLLWAARAMHCRLDHQPVDDVIPWLRGLVLG